MPLFIEIMCAAAFIMIIIYLRASCEKSIILVIKCKDTSFFLKLVQKHLIEE